MLTTKFAEGAKQQTPVQGRRKGNMYVQVVHTGNTGEHIHGMGQQDYASNIEETKRRIDIRGDIELLTRDRCVR